MIEKKKEKVDKGKERESELQATLPMVSDQSESSCYISFLCNLES